MADLNHIQETNSPSMRRPEPGGKTSSGITSIMLKGLFIIALFYTLYFTRELVLPLVLASLLTFLLRPVVRTLKRLSIPQGAGAAIVLLVLLGIASYGVLRISRPAAEWVEKVPESLSKIELKVSLLHKPLETLNRTAEELKKIARMGEEKKFEVEIKKPALADTVLTGTQEFLAKTSVMFILLYFLLASGDLFLNQTVKVFPGLDRKKEIVKIIRAVEDQISRYLFTVTVINIFMGVSLGISMYLIGMPNSVLWGVMAGFLVFLPYLGPLIGIAIVTLVASLTFDGLGRIVLAPAIYLALEAIQGQIITPMVLGIRLALNPVAIFVWLIFWGWMWGVVGALLAVPMLMVLQILCEHIPRLAPLGEFLGR